MRFWQNFGILDQSKIQNQKFMEAGHGNDHIDDVKM